MMYVLSGTRPLLGCADKCSRSEATMLLGQISCVAATHDLSKSDVDRDCAAYQVCYMLLVQKLDTLIESSAEDDGACMNFRITEGQ